MIRSSYKHLAISLSFIALSFFILFNLNTPNLNTGEQKAQVGGSLNDGLIAHYSFDDGSGTTLADSSGNNNSQIVNGSDFDWVTGKFGKAYNFNGLNSLAKSSNGTSFEYSGVNELSFFTWFKPSSQDVTSGVIISKPWNNKGQYNYNLYYGNGNFSLNIGFLGKKPLSFNAGTKLGLDSWNHVGIILGNNLIKIYANGNLVKESTYTITDLDSVEGLNLSNGNIPLTFGCIYPYPSGWEGNQNLCIKGSLDSLRIYNRSLTTDEISALYNEEIVQDDSVSITNFSLSSETNSLVASITDLSASGSVSGYYLSESNTKPDINAEWLATKPTSYSFDSYGRKILYAWVKDTKSNISESISAVVELKSSENNSGIIEVGSNIKFKINDEGYLEFIKYNGNNKLSRTTPFFKVYLSNGAELLPKKFGLISGLDYLVEFQDSDIKIKVAIVPNRDYLIFEITDILNPSNRSIKNIEFVNVYYAGKIVQNKNSSNWANNASNDELFMMVLPANIDTVCLPRETNYTCQVLADSITKARGILVFSTKGEYFRTIERVTRDEGLPYVEQNGQWFRSNGANIEPYIFAAFTHDNHDDLLRYAQKGNFKQVLMIDPLIRGSYNLPRLGYFNGLNQMIDDMKKFVNSGIKVGIHTFFNNLDYEDPNFNANDLLQYKIGTLGTPISPSSNTIGIQNFNKEIFEYYGLSWIGNTGYDFYIVKIGNEFLKIYPSVQGTTLNVIGSTWNSTRGSHAIGSEVFVIPHIFGKWGIMRFGSATQNTAINNLANLAKSLNVNFFYTDGWSYPETKELKGTIFGLDFEKYAVWPYLVKVKEKTGNYPLIQTGSGIGTSFFYFFNNRSASLDGIVFENKLYTKNKKVSSLSFDHKYRDIFMESGWWKLHGSILGEGKFDHEATTFDDVHYVMMKTLAAKTSMGLQIDSTFYGKPDLERLVELIGQYNNLIRDTVSGNKISDSVSSYLLGKETEADLVSGSSIIEKRVERKKISIDSRGVYEDSFNVPFENAGSLKIEIRPKFDYYGYDNSENQVITDFSNSGNIQLVPSSGQVSCNLGNDKTLTITNRGISDGSCRIEISGRFNFTHKRGFALGIKGDGILKSISVDLIQSKYYSRRLYNSSDVGSGDTVLYFTDPIVNDDSRTYNEFDFGDVRTFSVVFDKIKSGQTSSVKLDKIVGLKEKTGNALVNPTIIIGNKEVKFPGVSLFVDDTKPYILEYDAFSGNYSLYSSNYKLISNGKTTAVSGISRGRNNLVFKLDTSNVRNLTRADIRISIYDSKALFGNSIQPGATPDPSLPTSTPNPNPTPTPTPTPPPPPGATNGLCATTLNSCKEGSFSDTEDTSTKYNWSCLGLNGGFTASCSQNKYIQPPSNRPPGQISTKINYQAPTINIPTTTVDISMPKLPSWLDFITAFLLDIVSDIIRGVKRTGEMVGI
jgi:hypothetical protein